MSGIPSFLSSKDSECSTGNPLDGITKQFGKDRSLQQGSSQPLGLSQAPQQAFRQAFREGQNVPNLAADQMTREFFGGAAHKRPENFRPDTFDFRNINNELQAIPNGNAPIHWASEFQQHGQVHREAELMDLNRAFNMAAMKGPMINNFQPMAQANLVSPAPTISVEETKRVAMDNAFNQARMYADRAGFYFNQAPMYNQVGPLNTTDLLSQPNIQVGQNDLGFKSVGGLVHTENESAIAEDNLSSTNELSEAAKRILNSTQYTYNEKFKNSEFLTLLKQLSNNENTIQGPRIVELPPDAQTTTKSAPAKESESTAWESEFAKANESVLEAKLSDINVEDGAIFNRETAVGVERNWYEEFQNSLDGPLQESFVAGSIEDFEAEFAKKEDQINFDDILKDSLGTEEEWIQQYRQSIEPMLNETDAEWESQKKAWNEPLESAYRATDAMYDSYSFVSTNPFTQLTPDVINQTISQSRTDPASRSLGDTILALEAALQKDPTNADLWTQLGIKQQENEREEAAISALRKAISLDVNALDAYMALSVSYTNENYYVDAYQSLFEWISRHPEYKSVVPPNTNPEMSEQGDRKSFIQNLFLNAARQRPGNDWDPNVQIALGVLFNISEEYNKAIDCFRAALSKQPNDYMVWNKLGATMANAQDPKSATEAYFNALEIQPSYIRARYNLAIASINMQHYREAAEHLLGALSLQKRDLDGTGSGSMDPSFVPALSMSSNIWDTLKMIMYMLNEPSLADASDARNLDEFRTKFEF
ncbi:hypothetical protein BB559_006182 [Furculomyces boomerangus]|uniref:Uncharacterized protein n=1 Tax=Furculomyces boomerangus TaxID=61424 RepID=A0A2T9Y4B1_9FUNG|nr:hypothetical protein BB559_006182 [Furculomyces boomerangus]